MALPQTSTSTSTSTSHAQLPIIPPDSLTTTLQNQNQSPSFAPCISPPVASPPSPLPGTASPFGTISNDTVDRPKHRQSALSTSSSKQSRSGLFTLAALARDKTTNVIASLSEPSVRPRISSNSLYRSAQNSPSSLLSYTSNSKSSQSADSPVNATDLPQTITNSSTPSRTRTEPSVSSLTSRQSLLETNPPSQAYSNTASDTPAPITFVPHGNYHKMHQTSSRLLRMTSDDRPFTRVSCGGRDPYYSHVNMIAGFQRFICNISRQLATRTSPGQVYQDRTFISIRRGHQ